MEFISHRNSINSRKGRKGRTVVNKFKEENYWKSRTNRALHQLSRSDNECDPSDFLLPEKRLNRWDIHAKLNNEWEEALKRAREWRQAKWQLVSNPPHLGAGWTSTDEELPIPKLERSPPHEEERWTIHTGILHYENQADFLATVHIMETDLNIIPRELTYDIYRNGVWTTHRL